MNTLVDTSVIVGRGGAGAERVAGGWAVSVVTVGELHAGVLIARESAQRAARLRRLSAMLAEAPVIEVDRSVASCYGELRAATGRAPASDLWIAATALAHDLVLLTADERQAALPLVRTRRVAA